jgi:hypothetical protein
VELVKTCIISGRNCFDPFPMFPQEFNGRSCLMYIWMKEVSKP